MAAKHLCESLDAVCFGGKFMVSSQSIGIGALELFCSVVHGIVGSAVVQILQHGLDISIAAFRTAGIEINEFSAPPPQHSGSQRYTSCNHTRKDRN